MLSHVRFGGRGENRLRQAIRLTQTRRKRDAAHPAGGLIVLPAGADEIAPDDGLHGQGFQAFDHQRPTFDGLALAFVRQDVGQGQIRQMIRNYGFGLLEPENGQVGEHGPFSGNGIGKHHVERRQTVRGDDEHMSIVHGIDVSNFATVQQIEARKVAFENGF